MAHNIVRREVQRRDDPFGIPACFYWTVDEVADWVDSIGYGKYKENFRSHFINGRKLLTVDACVLPKMGITHFGDILDLSKHLRDQAHIKDNIHSFKLYYPFTRRSYVGRPQPSGRLVPHLSFMEHINRSQHILQARTKFLQKNNYSYTGWTMEPWWDQDLRAIEASENQPKTKDETSPPSSQEEMPPTARNNLLGGGTLDGRLRLAANKVVDRNRPPDTRQRVGSNGDITKRSQLNTTQHDTVGGKIKPTKQSQNEVTIKKDRGPRRKAGTRPVNRPYLPVVFHWEKMQPTTGYPKVEIKKIQGCN